MIDFIIPSSEFVSVPSRSKKIFFMPPHQNLWVIVGSGNAPS